MKNYEFCEVDLLELRTALVEFSAAELLGRKEVMQRYEIDSEWINSLVLAGCERLSSRLEHVEKRVIA